MGNRGFTWEAKGVHRLWWEHAGLKRRNPSNKYSITWGQLFDELELNEEG